MIYEYKMISVHTDTIENEFGAVGWELITIKLPEIGQAHDWYRECIFKRVKINK